MGIKYSVNEKAFLKWGHDMAYVLGYIFADGGMENSPSIRGKYLRVTSNDKESILFVRNFLSAAHPIVKLPPSGPASKGCYFMRVGSHAIYNSLVNYGLHPNKSLTIQMPKIPKKFLADFVRGNFDGDGCVYIEKQRNKEGKLILKRLRIVFTSGSKRFLEQLAHALYESGQVNLVPVRTSHRSYQIQYGARDSVGLFKFLYGHFPNTLYLSRKFDIFKEYFRLKPQRIDGKVLKIMA